MDTDNVYYWNGRLVSKNVYMALLRGLNNPEPAPEPPDLYEEFENEDDDFVVLDEDDFDYEPDYFYDDEVEIEKAQDRYEKWLFGD